MEGKMVEDFKAQQEEARTRALESLKNTLREIEESENRLEANGAAKSAQEENFITLVRIRRIIGGKV